jgi:hypothetical protein
MLAGRGCGPVHTMGYHCATVSTRAWGLLGQACACQRVAWPLTMLQKAKQGTVQHPTGAPHRPAVGLGRKVGQGIKSLGNGPCSLMVLDKVLDHSLPQFPHLQKDDSCHEAQFVVNYGHKGSLV